MLVLEGLVGLLRSVQLQLLQHYWWGTDLDYCDIEWFAAGIQRDIGRTDAEDLILRPPDVKSRLIGKDSDAGKD